MDMAKRGEYKSYIPYATYGCYKEDGYKTYCSYAPYQKYGAAAEAEANKMNADPAKRAMMMADAAMKDGEAMMEGAATVKRHLMMNMDKEIMEHTEDESMVQKRDEVEAEMAYERYELSLPPFSLYHL
jgi:hypothetical protein